MDSPDIQTNWTGGEVSLLSAGRFDVQKYRNGAATIQNFLVKLQGGLFYRPGFRHVANANLPTQPCRLLGFMRDENNTFLIELGHEYLRIYENDTVVQTLASPWTAAQIWDVDFEQSYDTMWLTHGSYKPRLLERRAVWTLTEMVFTVTPYYSSYFTDDATLTLQGIFDRRTLTSASGSFAGAALGQFVQYVVAGIDYIGAIVDIHSVNEVVVEPYEDQKLEVADEVYIIDTTATSIKLSASAVITRHEIGGYLYLAKKDIATKQWFKVTSIKGDYGQEANGDHIVPVFISDDIHAGARVTRGTLVATSPIFDSADGDIFIRLHFDNHIVNSQVYHYNSDSSVNVDLNRVMPLGYTGRTNDWRWGMWHNGNWPQRVSLFEQRMIMAGTYDAPNGTWLSETDRYDSYAQLNPLGEVQDDSGINYDLATTGYSTQRWIMVDKGITFATAREIFRAGGNSTNGAEPVTPRNYRAISENNFGTSKTVPVRVGPVVIYVQDDGRAVREFAYDFNTDSFESLQLNMLAEHILQDHGGSVEMALLDSPDPVVFIVTGDGQLVAFTYVRDQEITAFTRFVHGIGTFESVCTILSDGVPVLYAVVNHDGVRRIEKLADIHRIEKPLAPIVHLDSAVPISGVSGSVIALPNLANRTVRAVLDGEAQPPVTLDATGTYTLTRDVTVGWIGVGYRGLLGSLPVRNATPSGSPGAGVKRRLRYLTVALYGSLSMKYGTRMDRLIEVPFRSTNQPTGTVPPMFTGEKRLEVPDAEQVLQPTYIVVQDDPYPLNILGVYLDLQQN